MPGSFSVKNTVREKKVIMTGTDENIYEEYYPLM